MQCELSHCAGLRTIIQSRRSRTSGILHHFRLRFVMALASRCSVNLIASTSRIVSKRAFKMSARLRAEEAVEEMAKKNPYFNKYASKIAALQQTSPEEFLNRLDSVKEKNFPKKSEEVKR